MKKEIYLPYFENKKITAMGLGLLGRGLGDIEFFAKNGAELIVNDKKTEKELVTSVLALSKYKNITYHLGEHRMEDFENRDFIFKASSVPLDSENIKYAKSQNTPVYMSAALVCGIVMKNLPNVKIIGITGTRGKSTTTQMIAHILKSADKRVSLGGNIRGVANLPLLDEIEDGDFLVLELDSWQLQGFGDMKISPHISVFTSFLDDHMNYYKNDKELYFNDKANIYRNQKKLDVLIVSPDAEEEIKKRDPNQEMIIAVNGHIETNLIGEHNQTAAKMAYEVASQCGLVDKDIRGAIATFKAVEGRLEDIGIFKGVKVFNDNNGTTGDATVKALESIITTYNLKPILIVGGNDKGLPIDELEKAIKAKTKEIIYLSGTGTDRISLPKKYEFEKLADCIKKAFELAGEGDVILFSPAFASFSKYFNNEYERNDEFVMEVGKYKVD
ncbi:MAG: UDP-N-acetylmuramoyl-L-alanine--D-glutamate ligase [Candidatus Nomurabacteria bacterium]|nr:UDP-N-acetylmuramoyl-L-alanine--D-glutamate ligase [Candidatus Nomurabacteria bacterium]